MSATTLAFALLLGIVVGHPAVRVHLESTMFSHMLVQIPALAGVGVLLANCFRVRRHASRPHQAWTLALAAVVAAIFILTLWMVPKLLDGATLDWRYEIGKFMSVPLAGFLLRWGWPVLPVLAKLVIHVEVIASLFRFGWGYAAAPARLCSAYPLLDQQDVGAALLLLGFVYSIEVVAKPLFGASPLTSLISAASHAAQSHDRKRPARTSQ